MHKSLIGQRVLDVGTKLFVGDDTILDSEGLIPSYEVRVYANCTLARYSDTFGFFCKKSRVISTNQPIRIMFMPAKQVTEILDFQPEISERKRNSFCFECEEIGI